MSRTAFVVEDEAVVSMQIADILEHAGITVGGVAARGEDALARIPSVEPDVIVVDIRLAGAMSGLDMLEALGDPDAAVVILTAHADRAFAERATRGGASAYVVKPFHPDVLLANVDMALARRQAAQQVRRSEARLRGFLDTVAAGIADLDPVRSDATPTPAADPSGPERPEPEVDQALRARIERLIQERMSDPRFSIGTLARALGVSRRQLHRDTHRLFGVSPVALLLTRRLEEGQRLMRRGAARTVKEVAARVGLSPSYYSRAYARWCGRAPSDDMACD